MANKANRIELQRRRNLLLAAGWKLADIQAHPYLFPVEQFRRDKSELELRVTAMRKHMAIYNRGRPRYRQATAKVKILRQIATHYMEAKAAA